MNIVIVRCNNPTCAAELAVPADRNRELYEAMDAAGWQYHIDKEDGSLVVHCMRCTLTLY